MSVPGNDGLTEYRTEKVQFRSHWDTETMHCNQHRKNGNDIIGGQPHHTTSNLSATSRRDPHVANALGSFPFPYPKPVDIINEFTGLRSTRTTPCNDYHHDECTVFLLERPAIH